MDKLDKLTIRGFKSIRSLEEFEFRSLNILIGENGSGKSNLISFFRLLWSMMSDPDTFQKHVRENGGADAFLYNGPKETSEIYFETLFGKRGYRFKLLPTRNGYFHIANEARLYLHGTSGWWELNPNYGPGAGSRLKEESQGSDQNAYNSRMVVENINSWQIYHFHDTSGKANMRNPEIPQDNRYLRSDAANIAPFLLRLQREQPDSYGEIVATVRMVMPFFREFNLQIEEFGPKQELNLSWFQRGSDFPMQPYHLSDGSIRFICLATALLQPYLPSAIIIDEPELGLHPDAIGILADLLQAAAKRTQVIIATQSPALINHFSVEDIVTVNWDNEGSSFDRLDAKELKVWLEDYSLGDIWSRGIVPWGSNHG